MSKNTITLIDPIQESSHSPTVSSGVAVEQSRAIQEVQGAILMAKKFPRDEDAAYARIITSCKRKSLAEVAMYAYPRGGQTVTGASIRLAETIAKAWGNMQFGIVELEQDTKAGRSEIMTYAWDLETNTREVKSFTVPHERHTKKGVTKLTDPRDIYELIANQAARRLRSCIFGVLPGDVVEEAINQCEKTLQGNSDEPLADRVRKAVSAFSDYGVTKTMIEKRLAHKLEATTIQELVNLQKIYRSLKDGMTTVGDFFETPDVIVADENKNQTTHPLNASVDAAMQQKTAGNPPMSQPVTDISDGVISDNPVQGSHDEENVTVGHETTLPPLDLIPENEVRTQQQVKIDADNMMNHLKNTPLEKRKELLEKHDPGLLKSLANVGLGMTKPKVMKLLSEA